MADNNLEKFQNQNPLQKFFLGRFYHAISEEFSRIEEKQHVADIGCGEGFTIRELQKIAPASSFHGIDPDKEALVYARERDKNATYEEGSIFTLPFEDSSFDVVLCNEVLEHLEKPLPALRELHRISKGYLILSVPHEPLFRISNLLRGRNILRFGNYPYHLNTWSTRGFKQFVSQVIDISAVRTPFPWTLVVGKVRKHD